MITIGIDPGIEKTGIGIIEKNSNILNLLYYKLIKTSSKESQSDRLNEIHVKLTAILKKFKIDSASVEKLYFSKNIKTALTVSEARGVILLTLRQNNIPVYEYTPLQVKQALIGYGRAGKSQMQNFIRLLLNLKETPKPDDVADGIALAIIHMNYYKTLSKVKGGKY